MSQFFPVDKLIIAALLLALVVWVLHDCYHAWQERICSHVWPKVRWSAAAPAAAILLLLVLALLSGCADPINPVRYQPVEVLVTKPCFQGHTPPAEAVALTEPVCTGSDAECVRAAKADILELQREARQYRLLFKECSK